MVIPALDYTELERIASEDLLANKMSDLSWSRQKGAEICLKNRFILVVSGTACKYRKRAERCLGWARIPYGDLATTVRYRPKSLPQIDSGMGCG